MKILINQEVHGELIVQKSHNFFEEIKHVDFIGLTKFDCIVINPLLQIIGATKSQIEVFILNCFSKALRYSKYLFLWMYDYISQV